MKKNLLALALGILATGSVFAQPKLVEKVTAKKGEVVIPYEKYVMPNGLTVIIHEDHSDPLVHVDVTYHVGSAREEINKSGFAHFFEHMMFQGSDNVGDEQHFKIVSEAGGTLNGTTNLDRTNYFETLPANQLEKALWLEADRMGFLLDAVTQQKFEIQRSTVKNERGQNYDNRPYGLLGEFTSKHLYPYGHPYSWLTIGYVEDLNRVDVNDLKRFFLRWYGPNNATLTIGGDVNTAQTLKWVEKYFGSIPMGPAVEKTVLPAVVLEKNRYVSFTDNYARLGRLQKTFPTVPNYHPDMYALSCLSQILGQGKNSILYQELVKTQKALSALAFSRLSELAGEMSFSFAPAPGHTLAEMDSLFYASLKIFETRGVTDEDIRKFKGSLEAQYINGLASVQGKVSQLAAFQTFTGNPNQFGVMLAQGLKVTKEDVWRVYEKYIKGKYSVTVSVLTKSGKDVAAAPDNYTIDQTGYKAPDYGYNGLTYKKAKDNFDRSKMPAAGPAPLVASPKVWKGKLSSGIQVIGTTNSELPVISLIIRIPGGHLSIGKDFNKAGLPGMMAEMMNEDTEGRTSEEMAVELQTLGSSINVSSSLDGLNISVSSLKKNLAATMALVEERLFKPKFTEAVFKRLQRQTLESFRNAKTQASSIASNLIDEINYGADHILGVSQDGNETTVKSFTLKDVEDYYKNHLTSVGTRVLVSGDVQEDEVISSLNFLNNLPNKTIELAKPAPGKAPEKTTIFLVDVPKAAQTEFRVSSPTNLMYDATGEYFRAGLLNYAVGGSFNSRLNLKLREEKGWTYGARSSFSGDKYSGDFTFSSGIRADATDSALVEIMQILTELPAKGLVKDEVESMRKAIGQRDALAYETGTQKAGFIGRLLEYNLPENYTTTQNNIVKTIKKAELDALAKKWINPGQMNVLLVGDKAKILPGLQKLGYSIVELDADGNKK